MKIKAICMAAAMAIVSGGAAISAPLTFDYSFNGVSETVTGQIFGLEDNATGAATIVTANSPTLGFVSFDSADPGIVHNFNTFTVVGGAITSFNYLAVLLPLLPGGTDTAALDFGVPGSFAPFFRVNGVGLTAQNLLAPDFSLAPQVPLPATGLLIPVALASFAFVRRASKKKA